MSHEPSDDDVGWADCPDEAVTGRWVPIWRAPTEGRLLVWLLSEECVGCYLRWNGEYSEVLRPSELKALEGKPRDARISWRGHLWAWDVDRIGILQLSRESIRYEGCLANPAVRQRPLRGQRLHVWRAKPGPRGHILARLDTDVIPRELPRVGDLRAALRYVFRSNQRLGANRSVRLLPLHLEPREGDGTNG